MRTLLRISKVFTVGLVKCCGLFSLVSLLTRRKQNYKHASIMNMGEVKIIYNFALVLHMYLSVYTVLYCVVRCCIVLYCLQCRTCNSCCIRYFARTHTHIRRRIKGCFTEEIPKCWQVPLRCLVICHLSTQTYTKTHTCMHVGLTCGD